ncbi:hypothetical protein AB0892_16025 [Streptomyces sp. NPDC005409]
MEGRTVTSLMEAMARIPYLPAWLPGADTDLEAALDAHDARAAALRSEPR